jgi:hypothetical protein
MWGASQSAFYPPVPPLALQALRAGNVLPAQDAPGRSGDNASWCTKLPQDTSTPAPALCMIAGAKGATPRKTRELDRALVFRHALWACRRAIQPSLQAADAHSSPATAAHASTAARGSPCQRDEVRRKWDRPRVAPCARDLRVWASGTGRGVGFGRDPSKLVQRW